MYSSLVPCVVIWMACHAIVVNREVRDIVANTKIELQPVTIACKLNDLVILTAPVVNCNTPLYYLSKPNGDNSKLNFDQHRNSSSIEYLFNEIVTSNRDRRNYRRIDLNFDYGQENREDVFKLEERTMKPNDFFMGPFTLEDHGNWMLSVYCQDIDSIWVEMFQTISVIITETVPLKVSETSPKLGSTLEISFAYPIKGLETCELTAPSSTFDRYYDRNRIELDKCGYVVSHLTREDEGVWTITGVGQIVYRGMVQLGIKNKRLKD